MFREMRRSGQALSEQECLTVLENAPRGVLALHGEDGYPYALPMDHVCGDGTVYFHCAKQGHKLDALAADDRASFCVMDEGSRSDGDWALSIRSVILFGHIRIVDDPNEIVWIARRIAQKYYPTPESAEAEVRKAAARVCILELSVDHMTGKLVHEA